MPPTRTVLFAIGVVAVGASAWLVNVLPVSDAVPREWLGAVTTTVVIVMWGVREAVLKVALRPSLIFGDPEVDEVVLRWQETAPEYTPNPWPKHDTGTWSEKPFDVSQTICLWRVPIRNDGGGAEAVSVRIRSTNPKIATSVARAALVKAGVPRKADQEFFPLPRRGEESIDVISITKYPVNGQHLVRIHKVSGPEVVNVKAGSYRFDLRALTGNDPTDAAFDVQVDPAAGVLTMVAVAL